MKIDLSLKIEDLSLVFEEAGYRSYPPNFHQSASGVVRHFQRVLHPSSAFRDPSKRGVQRPSGMPGCVHNDDRLFFNVTVYDTNVHGLEVRNVTFDLIGSFVYPYATRIEFNGVPWDLAVADLARFETGLLSAWEAAAKNGLSGGSR